MGYLDAIILGIIQGFTEFLPVSSSGHLALYSRVTGVEGSLGFDVAVHAATLIAVLFSFRGEIKRVAKKPFSREGRNLIVATAATALVAFALKGVAERTFSNYETLPLCFALSATIIAAASLFPRRTTRPLTALDSAIIGLAQGAAVFPGLSRSGVTLSAASLLGADKRESSAFCFLISVPIVVGSAILSFSSGGLARVPFGVLACGFVSALACGFVALRLLKSLIGRAATAPFAVYLALLSVILTVNDRFFGWF